MEIKRAFLSISLSVIVSLLILSMLSSVNADVALQGNWHIDEGAGTTTADASGNGNSGTINGAGWVSGKIGQGLQFDGTDDYVNCGNAASLDITGSELTIEAWVKYLGSGSSSYNVVVAKEYSISSDSGYSIYVYNTSRRVVFDIGYVGNSDIKIISDVPVKESGWSHIVAVYNATDPNNMYMSITVDGVTKTEATTRAALISNAYPLWLGDNASTSDNRYFNGLIDEVSIYSRAWSTDEIYKHYLAADTRGNWHIDEGTGTTTADASGNGNSGTIYGAGWVNGKIGKGLQFDGTDDYVNCGNAASLDITGNELTIEAWVKYLGTGSGTYNVIAAKGDSVTSDEGYSVYVCNTTREVMFAIGNSGTADVTITSDAAVKDGGWSHIVAVYNATDPNNMYMSITVDGVTKTEATTRNALITTTNPLQLGDNASTSDTRYFNGLIDEVSIYSRAWTQDEIYKHYLAARGNWHIDEGTGTTTADASGNGNSGTINGAGWVSGKIGQGLQFDGTDDYVNCGNTASLDVTGSELTIEAWVKYLGSGSSSYNVVVAKEYSISSDSGYSIYVYNTSRRVVFDIGYVGNSDIKIISDVPVKESGWSHIVAVYNATDPNNMYMSITVDGVTKTEATTRAALISNAYPLWLGDNASTSDNRYFNGLIDEVSIYSRAWTPDEISLSQSCPVRYEPDDIDYAGNIVMHIKNPTTSPLAINRIMMDGRSVGKVWTTDETFLGSDVRDEYIKIENADIAWYRVFPNPIPAGGTAEVNLRLESGALVNAPRHDITAVLGNEFLTTSVGMTDPAFRLEYVGIGSDLDELYIYAGHQSGTTISSVEIDGQSVSTTVYDVSSDYAYAHVNLASAWVKGSCHTIAVRTADDVRSTTVRAFPAPAPLGIFGNMGTSALEQYYNHLFDATHGFTPVQVSGYDSLANYSLGGAYIYYSKLYPGEEKYEPVYYDYAQLTALNSIKGHSALWAYYLEDEPDGRGNISNLPAVSIKRDVERANQFCRIFDSATPTYLQIDHSGYPTNLYNYGQIPDYLSAHAYPLGGGDIIGNTLGHVQNTQAAARPRPFYYLNEGYCYNDYRAFEADEMRMEAYTALAGGAKSLQWYPAHGDRGLLAHPTLWNAVGEINGILHQVLPLTSIGTPVDGLLTIEDSQDYYGSCIVCGDKAMVVTLVNKNYLSNSNAFVRPDPL
ncbi:MAG: LamG domain-containing protein, partial [bacterium]|nr:LamG domain-containing protein [bacterium]